jgi:hypothetical protein
MKINWYRILLFLIVSIGLYLRLLGLHAGLPIILNGDEYTIIDNALHLSFDDLNPHVFMYGNFSFYIYRIWIDFIKSIEFWFIGKIPTYSDLFLFGRYLSVFFSTLIILTAYPLVKKNKR